MQARNKFPNLLVLTSRRKATSGKKLKKAYREAEKVARKFMNKFLKNMKIRSKIPEALSRKAEILKRKKMYCQKVLERKPTSLNRLNWLRKS